VLLAGDTLYFMRSSKLCKLIMFDYYQKLTQYTALQAEWL